MKNIQVNLIEDTEDIKDIENIEGIEDTEDIEDIENIEGIEGLEDIEDLEGIEDIKGVENFEDIDDIEVEGIDDVEVIEGSEAMECTETDEVLEIQLGKPEIESEEPKHGQIISCNAIILPRDLMTTSWVQREQDARGATAILLADDEEYQDISKIVFEKPTLSVCQHLKLLASRF